jgi:hypothetical protein
LDSSTLEDSVSTLSKSLAAGAAAFVLAATPAKAQMWYNGNWNGSVMLPDFKNAAFLDSRIYDNFWVQGNDWQVSSLFGEFLSTFTPTQAYWEIRSGVSLGNGGTLVHSGTNGISWVATGRSGFGFNEYRATINGLNLVLPADVYWLTIAPIGNGAGMSYVSGTSGWNGINPLLDGNAFWTSTSFNKNFATTFPYASSNFAYGLDGQQVVITTDEGPGPGGEGEGDLGLSTVTPEPGTVFLTATGLALVSFGVRLRRRVKA